MFHLVAYGSNIPAGTDFRYITPVPDPMIRIEGNNIIVPEGLNNVVGICAFGENMEAARLETPSLRRLMLWEINPVGIWGTNAHDDFVMMRLENPIVLDPSEPMRALAWHSGATSTRMNVLVWLADGPITPVTEDYFEALAVCSSVTGNGTWENATITFDQVLPAGRYAVIGARLEHSGSIAFRLSFVGQSWRPGAVTDSGRGTTNGLKFRAGKWGVWGEFPHDQPPTVDIITTNPGQAILILDLVKIG